jgi:hypothetical protein
MRAAAARATCLPNLAILQYRRRSSSRCGSDRSSDFSINPSCSILLMDPYNTPGPSLSFSFVRFVISRFNA